MTATAAPQHRFEISREQLATLLGDQPSYRVDQVWKGFYEQFRSVDELTNLSKGLRAELEEQLTDSLELVTASVSENGDTTKFLWRLHDGATIETVLMLYPDRATVCISTQAGCAMACQFCATGQAGFDRHLGVGEVVEQVIKAARVAAEGPTPRRISNIVFMGMGEPLANYDTTWATAQRLHADVGISARHLTISTVGIIPGIRRLAAEPLPVNLAVSLHAANDELRDELVPINKRYPLADLAEALHGYLAVKNRRLSFEWAMIDGVNDRDSDAAELAEYARSLRAHINLIPLNPTPGYPTVGSTMKRVREFRQLLEDFGANATIRQNRGTDIDAACGQLRNVYQRPKDRRIGERIPEATRVAVDLARKRSDSLPE
ncbi:MAG: 23S rRNA (adenine(2503)-C(2))-methyltransferase RlmN [Actinobacteria bacterium]|nr:23S rRNA (adenine(2503)-C(2))-methyltransferase RlmN [Actinomycetota bacterium]